MILLTKNMTKKLNLRLLEAADSEADSELFEAVPAPGGEFPN